MSIDLYSVPASPPCRAVLMVVQELGIEVNIKTLDLWQKFEHMTPEFLKVSYVPFILLLVSLSLSL